MAAKAFEYKNSKGTTYYLHGQLVTLRGGKKQQIYYFRKEVRDTDAVAELPAGYSVQENPRNGFLTLKRTSK
ncbi:MAG TPA: hypothetical protein VNG90_02715 [Candidatus Acidoferrum sp.]|nr:hypothetical protein [Candidatus Acidoferrum sp.]